MCITSMYTFVVIFLHAHTFMRVFHEHVSAYRVLECVS